MTSIQSNGNYPTLISITRGEVESLYGVKAGYSSTRGPMQAIYRTRMFLFLNYMSIRFDGSFLMSPLRSAIPVLL